MTEESYAVFGTTVRLIRKDAETGNMTVVEKWIVPRLIFRKLTHMSAPDGETYIRRVLNAWRFMTLLRLTPEEFRSAYLTRWDIQGVLKIRKVR